MPSDEMMHDTAAAGAHRPAEKDAGLADGYCARCDRTVMVIGVVYPDDHPEAAQLGAGVVSEWECSRCARREGRWTGSVLTGASSEPLNGKEDEAKIAAEQARFPVGSQPR